MELISFLQSNVVQLFYLSGKCLFRLNAWLLGVAAGIWSPKAVQIPVFLAVAWLEVRKGAHNASWFDRRDCLG